MLAKNVNKIANHSQVTWGGRRAGRIGFMAPESITHGTGPGLEQGQGPAGTVPGTRAGIGPEHHYT